MAQLRIRSSRNASRSVAISGIVALAVFSSLSAFGQVLVINKSGTEVTEGIDRRFAQIDPTKVALPEQQIDARGHQAILRLLVAEQGFAMRPLPKGKKGLTLAANGKLSPAGENYLKEVTEQGLSVKPGDRIVLSNI